MKTKLLKFGMPFMAFMLAIVFAFATENAPTKDSSLVMGYIYLNGMCESTTKNCDNIGTIPCTVGGQQVFETKIGTFCKNPLTHRGW